MMNTKSASANTKKQALLDQLSKIQARLDNLDKQRAEKITKLAKKYKLLELDEQIIEAEFSLIEEKHRRLIENNLNHDSVKKN
ncbi:MAG: hypothetical protein LEGION0403_FIIPPAGN_01788 [Legionella sp.]|uniref:hypothetical protein n=1 Tax=Legionella sp. TaxID=459 RepID=UPI003D0D84C2